MENPDSSGLSSSSSQRYEQLLKTVSSLQGDLQRTLAVCQNLKSDNEILKKNYEAMRGEIIGVREKYQKARKQAAQATEAKLLAERDVFEQIANWENKLHRKVLEYEELQQKTPPQDINALRVDIKEELEKEFETKQRITEDEVEKWRQMFYNVRREYEKIKTEYGQFTADSSKEMELLHDQAKAEAAALRGRVHDLEAALAEANKEDVVRRLERQAAEERARRAALEAELDQVRGEVAAREQAAALDRRAHQAALAEHHAQRTALAAERLTLARQVAGLEGDLERARAAAEGLREQLGAARDQVQRARHEGEDGRRAVLAERDAARDAGEKLRKEHLEEKLEFEGQLKAARRRAEVVETQLKEGEQKLEEERRARHSLEAQLTKRERDKTQALQAEIERHQKDLLFMKEKVREAQDSKKVTAEQTLNDLSVSRAEAGRLRREKEILQDKINALQAEIGTARADAQKVRQELNDEVAQHRSHREKLRQAEGEAREARGAAEEANLRAQYLEEEARAHQENARALQQGQTKRLAELQNRVLKEREAMAVRAKQEVAAARLRAKKEVRREKKKSAAYKQKVRDTHEIASQKAKQVVYLQRLVGGAGMRGTFVREEETGFAGDGGVGELAAGASGGATTEEVLQEIGGQLDAEDH